MESFGPAKDKNAAWFKGKVQFIQYAALKLFLKIYQKVSAENDIDL